MTVNLRARLKRVLAPAVRRFGLSGPYYGNVDGFHAGAIVGWVLHSRTGKGHVPVGLFTSSGMIASMIADTSRRDVSDVVRGDEHCGFEFIVTEKILEQARAGDGHLFVKALDEAQHLIGQVTVGSEESVGLSLTTSQAAGLRTILFGDLEEMRAHLTFVGEVSEETLPAWEAKPLGIHAKMFTTEGLLPDVPASGHPAYLDFVRYRFRLDEQFDAGPGLEASDHFLNWYLTGYRVQQKLRVPLSAELIDYLNAPLTMGGNRHSLSRMMWWRMMGRRDLMGSVNLNERESFIDTLFWWAHVDAPALSLQDCLVPDRFADTLRAVSPSRMGDAYPLSHFLERFHRASPQLKLLNVVEDQGRKLLVLTIMVMAARRPDMLRYIPNRSLATLLEPREDGISDFERFMRILTEDESLRISRARYTAAIRLAGYDLQSHRFTSRSREGHRFEALARPVPGKDKPKVDVQIIGPLAKASGLGQAARLSADILRQTGLSVRGVNYGLDNPAPEGFSSETALEDYGPAKINLIHLNAESIPLAFAYEPDVYSGAYNIGYFYWELEQPAYCHYLGIELLDEIWVATEYGVSIYKGDAKGKPVYNAGMCYEDLGPLDRRASRDFLNRRMMFDDGHYVCLVAFDSFSFVQRKNPVGVLKAFQKAFEGVENARLIVKTQNRDNVSDPVQLKIWERVDAIIATDPRIVILNETLSYRDLLKLKGGSDCYISLHKSEGWGFGMIEAMNLKVPVVCTAYSGNMDFCRPETCWLVDYEKIELRQGDYIFVRPGSVWAEPSVEDAARQLRAAYDNPAERQARAEAAYDYVQRDFSSASIAKRFGARLHEILEALK